MGCGCHLEPSFGSRPSSLVKRFHYLVLFGRISGALDTTRTSFSTKSISICCSDTLTCLFSVSAMLTLDTDAK